MLSSSSINRSNISEVMHILIGLSAFWISNKDLIVCTFVSPVKVFCFLGLLEQEKHSWQKPLQQKLEQILSV
jgi:hypothetical protein